MPFFAQVTWLDDPAKAWIWVILTAPTTVICFLVYRFYTKKELKLLRKSEESHEEDELESLDFELEG
jgi:amino acid permease